jgi:hypothetical protein
MMPEPPRYWDPTCSPFLIKPRLCMMLFFPCQDVSKVVNAAAACPEI